MSGRVRLAVVLLLIVVPLVGCIPPEALQKSGTIADLRGFRIEEALHQESIAGGVEGCRNAAWRLGGIMLMLLMLMTGCYVYWGWFGHAFEVTKGWPLGIAFAIIIIASSGTNRWYALDKVFRDLGFGLAEYINPGAPRSEDPYTVMGKRTTAAAKELRRALATGSVTATGEVAQDERYFMAMAVAEFNSSFGGSTLLWINSVGRLMMRWLLGASLLFLLGFYTQLAPLAGLCLILPATRRIFFGYCRTYFALCLWPPLYFVADRVLSALVGTVLGSLWTDPVNLMNPLDTALLVSQGTLMMSLTNFTFLLAYLAIPIAASKLVNAAGTPFRNR